LNDTGKRPGSSRPGAPGCAAVPAAAGSGRPSAATGVASATGVLAAPIVIGRPRETTGVSGHGAPACPATGHAPAAGRQRTRAARTHPAQALRPGQGLDPAQPARPVQAGHLLKAPKPRLCPGWLGGSLAFQRLRAALWRACLIPMVQGEPSWATTEAASGGRP